MPLDPLQERIARTALSLPEARTLALAGGAAMIAHGFVTRRTRDVDLFTRDTERPPLDHRFVTVDPSDGRECTVDVFADGGGRLRSRVSLDIGPVLHPDDLAADKLLALWGRARPRDFFDVHALLRRFGPERLLEPAASKDSGFTVATFLDALNAINRLTPEDWAEDGIETSAVGRLRSIFKEWHQQLSIGSSG